MATARAVPGPRHSLDVIHAAIRADDFHVYCRRALDIIRQLRKCGREKARNHVRQMVLSLTPRDYAHTLEMPNGQLLDVYGKLVEEEGWYVKIEIDLSDGEVGIVPCHPAEHDIRTIGGKVPRSRRHG